MTAILSPSERGALRISSEEELARSFEIASKSSDNLRIGLEHEKIGLVSSKNGYQILPYRGAPYEASIATLFEEFSKRGWTPIQEFGQTLALTGPSGSISIEPGGQFEFSEVPTSTTAFSISGLDLHMKELLSLSEPLGIVWIGTGFRPFGTLGEVPHTPKARYDVMRNYLPRHGTLGLEMMHRTATVQANFDYTSEEDAHLKMKVALSASPLVTALFASSPLRDGKPTGYQSVRAACWLDTDSSRCGLLPFVYESKPLFESYTQWALDVPMFFIYRNNTYIPVEGFPFRRFMKEGFEGDFPTWNDWELHLSTLFPDARLRSYIEVRSADSGPMAMVKALPAFWAGLFYSSSSLHEAWELLSSISLETLQTLRRSVPRTGIHTIFDRTSVKQVAYELIRIAQRGINNAGIKEEQDLLAPLLEITSSGVSVSDRIIACYESSGGNPHAIVDLLRYRACPQ